MNLRPSDLQLLTTDETARFLRVPRARLMRWRGGQDAAVELPYCHVGRGIRYPLRGVLRWLRENTVTAGGEPCPELWPEGASVALDPPDLPKPDGPPLAFVTREEAAERLGVTPDALNRWRRAGEPSFPVVKVGRYYLRYPLAGFAAVIREHTFTAGGKPAPDAWNGHTAEEIAGGPFLTTEAVAAVLAIHPKLPVHWRGGRWAGVSVPFVKLGGIVRYPERLLRAWIDANTETPGVEGS